MGIIFGPIASRRFGKSLGIDLSPGGKQCNFDCVYCELTPAKPLDHYDKVLPPEEILDAVREGLARHDDIDVLTMTANGEPTLYPHLAELMEGIDALRGSTRTLILSNASTIDHEDIRRVLCRFDTVKLSLDCATVPCFKRIDRPHPTVNLERIKEGMLAFRKEYSGNLIVEILVVEGINDKEREIEALDEYLRLLRPERIDLGTIDRPPTYRVRPVPYSRLRELSLSFDPSLHVHISSRKDISDLLPSSYSEEEILETLSKRPLTREDIDLLMDEESRERFRKLLDEDRISSLENNGVIFYKPSGKTIDN
ncbi:radical SAM protein [Nitratifractor sp.]